MIADRPVEGAAWVAQAIRVLDPRRNRYLYTVLAALLAGAFLLWATGLLPFYPVGWRLLAIGLVVLVWILSPGLGRLLTVAALLLPVAYTLQIGGDGLLLAMIVGLLGALMDPFSFLVLLITLSALFEPGLRPLSALAPLALVVGPARRGAVVAGGIAFAALVALLAAGQASGGVFAVPAGAPVVSAMSAPVSSLLDWGWLSASVPGRTMEGVMAEVLRPFVESPILLGQVALWCLAAGVAGVLAARPRLVRTPASWPEPLWPAPALAGIGAGAVILGFGGPLIVSTLGGTPATSGWFAPAALTSGLLVAVGLPILRRLPGGLGAATPTRRTVASRMPAREAASTPSTYVAELPRDRWEDLAGVDGIRAEIESAVASQFDPKVRAVHQQMGLRPVRGILLFGPPGTGKTKITRAMAAQAGVSFLAVSGSEFQSKFFGESEGNLRRVFDEARARQPSILFFDEIEAFLPKRSQMSRSDAPEKGVVATFLGLVDGAVALDGVLLVGATNYPNLIDEAAIRPGRFDKLIYVSAPDRPARRLIFERHLAGRPVAADIDFDALAARTERYSGADIAAVCAEATRRAIGPATRAATGARPIGMADLMAAIAGARPSITFDQVREFEALADRFGRRSERQAEQRVVERPKLAWDDVAGLDGVKEALREAIELPLEHPELVKEYNIRPPRGVLLFGPPGCGKTFLAKVVASAAGAHFLDVRGPELLDPRVGGSETQLRNLFSRARENAPCVLFFDEIDAIAGTRGGRDAAPTQILTQLLVEMDGVDELRGVVVMAATNRPDTLDPALLRPGRFDRVIYVPPPDRAARRVLIELELAGRPRATDLDLDQIQDATEGYSGADLAAICGAAAVATAKEALATGQKQVVTTDRLLTQIRRTPPSLSRERLAAYEVLRTAFER